MLIGIMEIEIYIYESNSLKEKRRVIKSLIERLRSRFNISISEIDDLDIWNKSTIGLSVVSNSSELINKSLSQIFNFIIADSRVEIIKHKMEIL